MCMSCSSKTSATSQTRPGAFGLRGAAVNGDRLPHKSCSNADKMSDGTDADLTVAEPSSGDSDVFCSPILGEKPPHPDRSQTVPGIQSPHNGASHAITMLLTMDARVANARI